jgi:hypothetical protein
MALKLDNLPEPKRTMTKLTISIVAYSVLILLYVLKFHPEGTLAIGGNPAARISQWVKVDIVVSILEIAVAYYLRGRLFYELEFVSGIDGVASSINKQMQRILLLLFSMGVQGLLITSFSPSAPHHWYFTIPAMLLILHQFTLFPRIRKELEQELQSGA